MSDAYIPFDLEAAVQEIGCSDPGPANRANSANPQRHQQDVHVNRVLIDANPARLARISDRLARANALKEKEISTISRISKGSIQNPHPDDVEVRAAILEYDAGLSREAAEALACHGHVVALPPCPHCKALGYRYQDGFLQCTATPAYSGVPGVFLAKQEEKESAI